MLGVGRVPLPVPAVADLLALAGGDDAANLRHGETPPARPATGTGASGLTTGDAVGTTTTVGRTPAVSVTFAPGPAGPADAVTQAMTAEELAAYRRLSADQQRRFAAVYKILPHRNDQMRLRQLLVRGTLTARAADGRTALEHLDAARTVPMPLPRGENKETYRREQIAVLIRHLADPTAIYQGNRSTCGPTTAQIIFATQRPADYVRFAVGLMSREGKGILPDGAVVNRLADALHGENDSRPAVSRMIQASLMAWASPVSYTDRSDRHGIELPLIGRVNLAAGASVQMMSQWLRAIRRDRTEALATTDFAELFDGGGPVAGVADADVVTAVAQDLERQRRQGIRVPLVPIELEWGSKSQHYLAISRVTADRVYFFNPHGNLFPSSRNDDKGRPRPLYRDPANGLTYVEVPDGNGGPRVRIYSDGSQSMSRRDVTARIRGAGVDVAIAAHHRHAPGNRFAPPF